MRLGIFGGTFDPIHIGHIAAAGAAMECAHVDRVIFIPSAQPPHRAAATAPAEDRLAMTNLAMQREPRFEVSDVEVTRGGRSYTADTLAELAREHPSDELFLILGWDAARLFRTWHQPDRVSKPSSAVIVDRPVLGQVNASNRPRPGLPPPPPSTSPTPTPARP